MDEEEVRLRTIFGTEEVPSVSKKTLRQYQRYLTKHLSADCRVTGREDFSWEEFYVFGPGDPEEYEELKSTRASYRDEFLIVKLLAELSPRDDLVALVKRLHDSKQFEIELSWLKAVAESTADSQLLDDFGSWQVNWQ